MDEKTVARFWLKIDKNGSAPAHRPELGPCWKWRSKRSRRGYGLMSKCDGTWAEHRAHRLSWEIHHGPIPDGASVCHSCDNPECSRPDHLFLGDQLANMRDMDRKGRRVNSPNRGSANGLAKLTEELVAEIRMLYAEGTTQTVLVDRYGVGQNVVSDIVLGKTWKHAAGPICRRPRNIESCSGVKNHNSKANPEIVASIRNRYRLGATKSTLSAAFGLSPTTIGQIVSRKTWRDVPDLAAR